MRNRGIGLVDKVLEHRGRNDEAALLVVLDRSFWAKLGILIGRAKLLLR